MRTYFQQHSLLRKRFTSCFASKQNDKEILAVMQSYHKRYCIYDQISCNTSVLQTIAGAKSSHERARAWFTGTVPYVISP